ADPRLGRGDMTRLHRAATYNGSGLLDQQLQTLASQEQLPYELGVSDDAAIGGTIAKIEAFAATGRPRHFRFGCAAIPSASDIRGGRMPVRHHRVSRPGCHLGTASCTLALPRSKIPRC